MSAPILRTMGTTLLAFLMAPLGLQAQATPQTKPLVEVKTTVGTMIIALYNETPIHRDNFLKLVREHYYDSTLLHRIVPEFIAQGGDPNSRHAEDRYMILGRGGPAYTLPPEIHKELLNTKGAVGALEAPEAMAEKRTHGSQFYFVLGQAWSSNELRQLQQSRDIPDLAPERVYTNDQLRSYVTKGGAPRMDGEFTVFGEIVEGLEVLDRLAALPRDEIDRPLTDVRIWMRVLE